MPSAARRSLAATGFAVIGFTDVLNRELSAGITDAATRRSSRRWRRCWPAILRRRAACPTSGPRRAPRSSPSCASSTASARSTCCRSARPTACPISTPTRRASTSASAKAPTTAQAFLPYAPEINAAALVAGGARLGEVLIHQAADLFLTVLGALFPSLTPTDIWVGMSMFQTIFDRQDAHNHARFLYRDPAAAAPARRASRACWLLEGLNDSLVPNHATDSLAWSMGPIRTCRRCSARCRSSTVVDGPLQRQHRRRDDRGAFYQYVPVGVAGIDRRRAAPCCRRHGRRATTAPRAPPNRCTSARSSSPRALTGVPVIIDPLAEGGLARVRVRADGVRVTNQQRATRGPLAALSVKSSRSSTCTPTSKHAPPGCGSSAVAG